ncbi:MAG: DUF3391 domain-containing protein [Burkholderiaceae bacterium]|nr:DUF3391 domain-containing protein [Burkholderiaceae bacterium]
MNNVADITAEAATEAPAVEDAEELVYAVPDTAPGGLQRVDTRRLLKGMFVAELDRPWSDTPLPQSGLLVETDEELQAVRHYCQFVMVDPARSSGELVAAIRAAAVLSADATLGDDDDASTRHGPAADSDAAKGAQSGARRPAARLGEPPKPRDDVHPSEATRAKILRLVRDGERVAPQARSALSQVRLWLGLGRRTHADDSPDTEILRHRQALQVLRDAWGDAIGTCDYGEGARIRESITLARPVHARLVAAADTAIRQVRQGTALAFEPLAEAADAFAASLASAPDAMRWLDAVYADNAPVPNHATGVALRLADLGRALGMEHGALRELTLIGLLSDIGKALLPREVLEHPGVLKPSDYALMKQHVTIGLDILSRAGSVPEAVTRGIAEHHERLDGSGYPRGLRGEAIGLHGRMAAIVDTFCALTAARAYANPLSADDALSALHDWSGSLFCRNLVEQFILASGAFPVGTMVELQTGEIAAVVDRRPGSRLQPKLVVMTGADKGPLRRRPQGAAPRSPSQPSQGTQVRIARGLPAGAFGLRLKDYYAMPA